MSIVLIGVAIAGTTSILAIINGVVFRPLPRAGAEGLVRVVESSTSRPPASTVVSNLTYTLWADRHDTIGGQDQHVERARHEVHRVPPLASDTEGIRKTSGLG